MENEEERYECRSTPAFVLVICVQEITHSAAPLFEDEHMSPACRWCT